MATIQPVASELVEGSIRLFFPPVCEYCHGETTEGRICLDCRPRLVDPPDTRLCWKCAATVGPYARMDGGCHLCRKDRFAFEGILRMGAYRDELATACRRIKELNSHRLAVGLGDLWCQLHGSKLLELRPTMVVPIPLHWKSFWRRGYNQAEQIADRIARHLRIPLKNCLWRQRKTELQSHLAPTERRKNVRGAFLVKRRFKLAGASVVLVDDILTTGSTCDQAARVLRKAGASRIVVAVIARGDNTNIQPIKTQPL